MAVLKVGASPAGAVGPRRTPVRWPATTAFSSPGRGGGRGLGRGPCTSCSSCREGAGGAGKAPGARRRPRCPDLSGGDSALAADECQAHRQPLPPLAADTAARLREFFPRRQPLATRSTHGADLA